MAAIAFKPAGSLHVLGRCAFLEGASAEAVAIIAASARWIRVAPGEMVVDFDDASCNVFFVLQGSVRVMVRTADGERTQILGDCAAGEMVGEMAAIDGASRSARIEALVLTQLCAVPSLVFLDAVLSCSRLALRLMGILTSRIRLQNRRLLEHTALTVRMRLAAEILRLSRSRPDGTRTLSPPPTQDELAERVGARRETVSRELSVLTQAGLLRRTRGAFVVDDPVSLQAMAERSLDMAAHSPGHH